MAWEYMVMISLSIGLRLIKLHAHAVFIDYAKWTIYGDKNSYSYNGTEH